MLLICIKCISGAFRTRSKKGAVGNLFNVPEGGKMCHAGAKGRLYYLFFFQVGVPKMKSSRHDVILQYFFLLKLFFPNSSKLPKIYEVSGIVSALIGRLIIITDFEVIKEAFNKKELSDRVTPESWTWYRETAIKEKGIPSDKLILWTVEKLHRKPNFDQIEKSIFFSMEHPS